MIPPESGNNQTMPPTPDDLRQRRIRHHKTAAFVFAALLVVVAPAWMYLRLMLCWGDMDTLFCKLSYLAPLLLILLTGVANVLTMFVLMQHGAELEASGKTARATGLGVSRGMQHMRHAYRELRPRQRSDVRQTILVFVVTWGALFAFMIWLFLEIPAGIGILLAIAFVIIAFVISRWMAAMPKG